MIGRAVIVGAGVGGLTTAIGLHRAGWEVTVLERWPGVVGAGAALGLWPGARSGLERVGLAAEFAAASVPAGDLALYRRDGRVLLRLRADAPRAPAVRLISRRRLMDVLAAGAAGIEIRTGVTADATVLRAELARADVLIGADGLRSGVRAAFFGGPTAPRYSGLVGWRGHVDFETTGHGETWGDGMLFGITPMAPGTTNFYAAFPTPRDRPGTLEDLRRRYDRWREPIPTILAAAADDRVRCDAIHDLHPPLRAFVTDRVALLGDAAHAMTPHLGRGACEAISDAVSLVGHLSAEPAVGAALAAYDRERRPPAQRIAARSWTAMRVAHSRRLAPVRNALVRAAGAVIG